MSKSKPGVVSLDQSGGPFVSPGANPAAVAYAQRLAQKKPNKINSPVAGPPVTIPRLDGPHVEGMTMAQQAMPQQQGSIVERPMAQAVAPSQLSIGPADLLPDEAKNDPAFIEGQGSMYAASQPRLALKYGVIRNGQRVPPQALQTRGQLRPETVRDMQALNELSQMQSGQGVPGLHSSETAAEEDVGERAAAAARSANMIGDSSEKPLTSEQKKGLENLDEFDLDSFRQMMMKDLLNNDEQRKIIEARLKPLNIEDLILHNRVAQRIPIVPGQFEPTLQSLTGEEDLALKRLIMQEAKSVEITDRYLLDKYSLMSVAISLKEINGKPMGDHTDAQGNFDDDAFWKKFNRILKLPIHMIASIGVNVFWFESRVRKLFVAEKVGNG